ncbi:Na+/H+ antiporter [Pedobacter insulae]|uniref:Sodium/proton antiporter, CPA1 family n=1 Tax=Pedobacter insulae TaxID=414048 RepID=A0A1I2WYZ9_9SPHI|nr:Na+/H+ antiporter [Pedobacter insulae]SFH06412.1 sodium/proton antiporter, CPA1 family [Pedobacter insulae]
MIEYFTFFLVLIVLIVLLIMLADRIKVAYPVLLVIAGLLISLIPGMPTVHIEPELIFIIFLPPLLYEAAFVISWKELWRWRRIVGSFAFVVVFLTAMSVAFVTNSIIPGFSLALGFLLGGIVSPPDAVSANAILKFVKLPKRMSSVLEGESLLNDASSLIIFRFAMIAVGTGQFVWQQATLSFSWMIIGGVAIGLLVGWLMMKAHKILPTDANIDIVLTLVAPYVMYIAAEEVHSSGVLAVVSGGLLMSAKRNDFLSSTSRLQGYNVWKSLIFLLNGLVFLLIGLDLPEISEGLEQEGIGFSVAVGYGLMVTAVLILGRFLASFGAVIVTKIVGNFIPVADKNPGLKAPLILGWSGMRGVVSLAAALSIPIEMSNGAPFPFRNLILFITFVVILTTLVLQGLTLPWLIKKVNIPDFGDHYKEEEAEELLKMGLAEHTLQYFQTNYSQQLDSNKHLQPIATLLEHRNNRQQETEMSAEAKKVYLKILEEQRVWLMNENRTDEKLDEEIVRKHLYAIDLEEEKLKYT